MDRKLFVLLFLTSAVVLVSSECIGGDTTVGQPAGGYDNLVIWLLRLVLRYFGLTGFTPNDDTTVVNETLCEQSCLNNAECMILNKSVSVSVLLATLEYTATL